ncbi:MAG: zinc ribbon domain-containing protein [Mycobacterium sp.]
MKSEVAQQRSLLNLADVDAELGRLAHRSTHLPEQQRYDQALAEQREAADRVGALNVALEDVDAQITRLEGEVDGVRKREDRDRGLLDGGGVNAKQLEELQHELGTLERRQSSLEDSLLEVMERREQLAGDHAQAQAKLDECDSEVASARHARDEALAGVENSRTERAAHRAELAAGIDAELVDLYEKRRAAAGVGAGRLEAGRCGACRIELDRGEIGRIAAASEDEVLHCPECRAILVRP